MMSEKTISVLNYLKEVNGANVTTADIAEALGVTRQSIEGVVTAGLCNKKLAVRQPAEIELEDGTHKPVKFVKLTEAGMAFIPGETDKAEDEAKAAAKAAKKADKESK